MEHLNWDDLLYDIEEQNAVLLLGHGFVPGAQADLRAKLQARLGDKLLHSYEREGLFLFADREAKTNAQKEAARFHRELRLEESILQKIAQLPFPLIVSANPDQRLLDALAQYQVPHQFDYFSCRPKRQTHAVGYPQRDQPLIYHLCGSEDDRDSLLLDYEDLFQMLKALLNDLGVPDKLRIHLKRATTYIFVGFHFERWYTQLFLRYLNMHEDHFLNDSSNYVLKTSFQNPEAQQFFLQQFNVKYIGADWSFFDELHRRFTAKFPQRLRSLTDTLSPTAATVVQLIEKADFGAAFNVLKAFASQLDSDDQTLILTTESQYSQYEQEKANGTSTQEHLGIMRARVRQNLIALAKKLS